MTEPAVVTDAVQPTISVQPTIALDPVCAAAIELAVAAAQETAGDGVGGHLGVYPEAERLVTHRIESLLAGYSGWYWAVTIGRAPGHEPTVAEVVLLPGEDAILAKPWVPWSQRVQPGDLSPGDLLPVDGDDVRLAPAYLLADDELADDDQVAAVGYELGLGRVRVLSRIGRLDAADRWFAGSGGPDTPMARMAPANCGTCGFFVSVSGSLRAAFGVCANEFTETDGRIVSVEHGCGAHSEAGAGQVNQEQVLGERGIVYDDDAIDPLSLAGPSSPVGEQLSDRDSALPPDQQSSDTDPALLEDPADLEELIGVTQGPVTTGHASADPVEPTRVAVTVDVLEDLGLDPSDA